MFGRLLGCYTIIHSRGLLSPDGISPREKFTLLPSLAFAYIGSVTARHSSSGVSQTLRHGTRNGITELSHRAPLISACRPSRWASAHILVLCFPFELYTAIVQISVHPSGYARVYGSVTGAVFVRALLFAVSLCDYGRPM